MKPNKTHPKAYFDTKEFGSAVTLLSQEEDCCGNFSSFKCCTRKCFCISGIVLLSLLTVASGVTLIMIFGIPQRPPVNRFCTTVQNLSGFLCDDRVTCVMPSDVCNGVQNCPSGADEDPLMCSDPPKNLPSRLIFQCGNPQFWIFIDRKCNYINDCGDCSDEIGAYADCPACGPGWWPCTSVLYKYCECIPQCLCQDGRQECFDWSDEYTCTRTACAE
ncbi:low-density lipoprotein receptor class A domain-containing protein 1-like [Anguilla rostrata]|uniref:low-density lipoprotein receptor class A domain-containing protein 1-like n=1 Tax=Anguilla rostrata TaxID=7938 RepID=UPI0015AC3FEE|nr:low-density lipoprotein receptor class A domain-containing protein 1-like isoform X1 [Anguilla anguilla]